MAILLEGKQIAAEIRDELKNKVDQLLEQGIQPQLSVVLVGDDPASVVYARAKEKACAKIGMNYRLHSLSADTSEEQILSLIDTLNQDSNVHGILIELPLPKGINKQKILEAVSPLKDVDGVHPVNRGHLLSGCDGLFPATPQSCIEILLHHQIEIRGKHVVLVGRGETVGKPMIPLLLAQDATLTICHTKTKDLADHTRQADILIAAAGRAKMITAEMVKEGAVVVDAGINSIPGGICGDVDFDEVEKKAHAITPVPGGVGSLTTVLIQRNVLKAIDFQQKAAGAR